MGVTPFTTQGPVTQIGTSGLIASLIGANLNASGDQVFTFVTGAAGRNWVCDYVLAANPSKDVSATSMGVFSGASASGQVFAADATWTGLTGTTKWQAKAGAAATRSTGSGTFVSSAFLNVSSPLGSAGTADLYIFGRIVS